MVAGEGIASPSGKEIDGKYLDQNEKDLMDRYKQFQKERDIFGVTLMCDSWTGPTRMSVINFLIYCNGVTWFHKSIDATGKSRDYKFLLKVVTKHLPLTLGTCSRITKVCAYFFQEIRKVVDEIGPEHIVHIVTDNVSNYKKACRQLREVYEHIVWTPCLAHTVNLMLKDIGQRPEHQGMITNCKANFSLVT
jgi:hypothetical protein